MVAEESISHEIAFRWVSLDLTDDKSTLVQVMAWCHQATSHCLSQCWPKSMSPNGVTRPQWVKKMGSLRHPWWYYFNKIKEPAHMVKNNSRRDLPVLSYYKPSQFNQGQLRNPTNSRIKFPYFSKAILKISLIFKVPKKPEQTCHKEQVMQKMFPFDDVIMNLVMSLETHFLQEHFQTSGVSIPFIVYFCGMIQH